VLSRRKAREVIEKGQVMVDGALVREPGTAVGDQSSIDWDENRRALPRVRARIPLLYEDDTLLVVDKPAGLLSVPSGPGAEGEDTALLRVREYVVRANPRRPFVGVVHRIDRDTSGALLFAKNADMRRALIGLFSRHALERKYLALVVGLPPAESGIVDAPIRDSYAGGRRAVGRLNEPARPARTRWRVVERTERPSHRRPRRASLRGIAALDAVAEPAVVAGGSEREVRARLGAHVAGILGTRDAVVARRRRPAHAAEDRVAALRAIAEEPVVARGVRRAAALRGRLARLAAAAGGEEEEREGSAERRPRRSHLRRVARSRAGVPMFPAGEAGRCDGVSRGAPREVRARRSVQPTTGSPPRRRGVAAGFAFGSALAARPSSRPTTLPTRS
jgi:16S rRNA U516 pseudouridylate synthase RsuA-like enzyme